MVSLVTAACLLVGAYALWRYTKLELHRIRTNQQTQYAMHKKTNQFLLSTIDWSSRRLNLTLYMRDMVLKEWKRAGYSTDVEKAFLIAETNVQEAEKYPRIDPILLLAMQCKESCFIDTARSEAGALGLNQIMPATGRLLCLVFGLAYSDSVLYDIKASTMLATKLLDVLSAQYQLDELVLAAYNGGPWQAHYYQLHRDKVCSETMQYVPFVLTKREEYTNGFSMYRPEESLLLQQPG